MTILDTASTTIQMPDTDYIADTADLAAAAFLARYSGRTLDAYRHDLRRYFKWTASVGLAVVEATRPHIELYPRRAARLGCFDDRSVPVDCVRVLPIRSHRRTRRLEPGSVRAPTSGLPR
jgi:hypothetical protein